MATELGIGRAVLVGALKLPSLLTVYVVMLLEPVFSTYVTDPVGSRRIVEGVVSVDAVLLSSDSLPLPRSRANEPTLFSPWLSTYNTPAGRDDELPQLIRNKLRPKNAKSAKSPGKFFDICSPSRFPSAGVRPPAITETEAFG